MPTTKVAGPATTSTAKKATTPAVTKAARPAPTSTAKKATAPAAAKAARPAPTSTAKKAAAPAAAKRAKAPSKAPSKVAAATAATGTGKPGKISPEQALANTRGLLDAKREQNRHSQSWQSLGPAPAHPGSEGFQSPGAIDKAEELHAGESRMSAIEGSVSTRGRQSQGKRDHR